MTRQSPLRSPGAYKASASTLALAAAMLGLAAGAADQEPPTAPGQPGFSAPLTNAPVLVTWAGSSDDGGSGLEEYRVEASANGGSYVPWTAVAATAQAVAGSFTFDGGEAYWKLRVRAVDGAGNLSPYSLESPQLTMDLTAPLPPSAPPAATVDGGFATVSWDVATDPLPVASGIQSYVLNVTSVPPGAGGSCGGTSRSCKVQLSPGHVYTMRVHAADNAGNIGLDGPARTLTFPGPVAGLRMAGLTSGPNGGYAVVGDPYPVEVEAIDVTGIVVPSYGGTVHFGAVDTSGPFPAALPLDGGSYPFPPADLGRHLFDPGYVFNAAGDVFAQVFDEGDSTISGQELVTVIPRGQVRIIPDANLVAARGFPYLYNAVGAVRAVSSEAVTFSTCDSTPNELQVDPDSGGVSWTPATGTNFPVDVCVRAQAASGGGEDTYRFQVSERRPSNALPQAAFTATPDRANAGSGVTFDSTASIWDPLLGPAVFRWRFGDGSPFAYRYDPLHAYLLPGGYRPVLALFDGIGRSDQTANPVRVLDRAGNVPPSLSIATPPPSGVSSLDVALQAQVAAGSSPPGPIRWDLGNGATAAGADVNASYLPGRYWATAVTVDQNGLPATDKLEIAVRRDDRVPPLCAATADPPVALATAATGGRAAVKWIAWRAPGTRKIASVSWTIEGVSSAADVVSLQYSTPGWRRGFLTVTDDEGLKCTDSVAVLVVSSVTASPTIPPHILDPGVSGPIDCKVAYVGLPALASGAPPLRWSLVNADQPVTIDAGAGTMTWDPALLPSADHVSYTLQVSNADGSDRLAVTVPYTCTREASLTTCGCGEGGAGLAMAGLGLLALWAAAARRRAAVEARARRP